VCVLFEIFVDQTKERSQQFVCVIVEQICGKEVPRLLPMRVIVVVQREATIVDNFYLLYQRKYKPLLVMVVVIPFFQQFTGINAIMFYAPVLFKTIGFGDNASLMSAVITGLVNVLSTSVSILTVDKYGRRFLFIEGGIQMSISQVSLLLKFFYFQPCKLFGIF